MVWMEGCVVVVVGPAAVVKMAAMVNVCCAVDAIFDHLLVPSALCKDFIDRATTARSYREDRLPTQTLVTFLVERWRAASSIGTSRTSLKVE